MIGETVDYWEAKRLAEDAAYEARREAHRATREAQGDMLDYIDGLQEQINALANRIEQLETRKPEP